MKKWAEIIRIKYEMYSGRIGLNGYEEKLYEKQKKNTDGLRVYGFVDRGRLYSRRTSGGRTDECDSFGRT